MITKNTTIILFSVLLLGLFLLSFQAYNLNAENAKYAKRIKQLEQEVNDYGLLQIYFQEQLDSLGRTCDDLARANAEAQFQLMEQRAKQRSRHSRKSS